MLFCSKCGAQNNDGAINCVSCGNLLGNPAPQASAPYYGPEQKSKLAAGLLNIFLSSFGVGRFYLGYTGIGVAQLLVSIFTCGIGSIWGFIDGILILTGSVKTDANGVPLRE